MENSGKGLLGRLKAGLAKTRKLLLTDVEELLLGGRQIDAALLEELEEALVAADVGPVFAGELIDSLRERAGRREVADREGLRKAIGEAMGAILRAREAPLVIPAQGLFTIMVVGVNGTGKTTTIGKLACLLREQGHRVTLAAADTFRAAAVEQLEEWARRADVALVRQGANADPAAVVYDALHLAKKGGDGVLIVDTAGRLHTKVNLMEELKKMHRVMAREVPGAPHEVMLVLDATTGQNAVSQTQLFHQGIGVTGLALTKLDGTAKGGVVVRIAKELAIPIRFIGVGEGIEDLRPFRADEFVAALFE